jgi:calcium/calmodulin-dependent protein kinase I
MDADAHTTVVLLFCYSGTEGKVLGEGEFGVVTLVNDKTNPSAEPMASKLLRKGAVFKDNTLYSAILPKVLISEIEILRTLQGKRYCMKMEAIYETRSVLYMVTELCAGGEMMEYVSKQPEDLRTEDVSRIAFQLLSAVDHCAKHGIIHRDIKPENCMFQTYAPGSALRLIDFGSGTINLDAATGANQQHKADDLDVHTTFAGSAFYISPEIFQHTYTYKTDVWSVGATLYVLVAGYPAADLQKAFNLLQKSKRDLHKLPNMPDNMPESYYELLDSLLCYQYKKRPSAGDVLQQEFVQFHVDRHMAPAQKLKGKAQRTHSVAFAGSVSRHALSLGFKTYERSLTTLLATVLSKTELARLWNILKKRRGTSSATTVAEAAMMAAQEADDDTSHASNVGNAPSKSALKQKLNVVSIGELLAILEDDLENDQM